MIITLTSDFGKQSQGVGMMEAAIAEIAPSARVIHYAHGIEPFAITSAARVLETVQFVAPAIHVCVCDPGVGTSRRAIALATRRGDILVGPDNGVVLPAARALGGIVEIREISKRSLMRPSVSTVFHGRDVFCPAAAHLAIGVSFESLGSLVAENSLIGAPYSEAEVRDGRWAARVIHIDKFGNAHLNIASHPWRAAGGADHMNVAVLVRGEHQVIVKRCVTFGEVKQSLPVLLDDNDGRVALAINQGSFAAVHGLRLNDEIVVDCSGRRADG
jgi:S-adenosylmethionine hydrolase